MVFGIGKKKRGSRQSYGGGAYSKRSYNSKKSYARRDRAYYSDDDYSSQGSYYYDDDEGMDYYDDEYYPEEDDLELMDFRDDERERELVTRDQVLGELRAQAAADALGHSLEQMGYNLDNCDSFYSLSDTEAKDNRYIVQPKGSELSNGLDGRKKLDSKRRRKSKKKKAKSSQSRYTVASDDDELTEDYTRNRRSGRDLDTFAESSMDSDEDSYFEDGTYITGRDSRFTDPASRFTGKTSRFTRRTGKRRSKGRKSKGRKRGDLDTYYSRGTEWTNGDSSYFRTIGDASTLSSMSSSDEESEMEDTMYTEVTSKSGRLEDARIRSGRKNRRTGKKERRRREMVAIQERNTDSVDEDDFEVRPLKGKTQKQKKQPTNWKRSDSSRLSGSSQIGAMRSVLSANDSVEANQEKGSRKKKETANNEKEAKSKKASKHKEDAELPSSDEDSVKDDQVNARQERCKSGKHKDDIELESDKENAKRKGRKSKKKQHDSDSASAGSEIRTKPSKKTTKSSRLELEDDLHPEIQDMVSELSEHEIDIEIKVATTPKSKRSIRERSHRYSDDESASDDIKRPSKSRKGKTAHNDGDDDVAHGRESKSKATARGKKSETKKEQKKAPDNKSESVEKKDGNKKEKVHTKSTQNTTKQDDDKSTKTSLTKTSKVSHALTTASKKFWPRQFLSSRNKKAGENKALSEAAPEEDQDNTKTKEKEDIDSQQEEKVKNGMTRTTSKKSKAENEMTTEQEVPADARDDDIKVDRGQSFNSARSRDRSYSPNRSRRSYRDTRNKSPSHRSRATISRDPKNVHQKNYNDENQADEKILPASNNETAKNSESGNASNQASSVGICEAAAMAALIPLAPLAAMYSCYTADATQAMIGNATNACAQECKEPSSACNGDTEAEVSRNKAMDENTRSTKKSRSKKYDDEKSTKSTRTSDRSQKTSRSYTKPAPLNRVPTLEEAFTSLGNVAASSPSRLSKLLSPLSPRSQKPKKPQRTMPAARIQEADEGFESFIPGSFDGSCLPFYDAGTASKMTTNNPTPSQSDKSQNNISSIQDNSIQRVQPQVTGVLPPKKKCAPEEENKNEKSSANKNTKKSKRWLPKIPKILPKKKEDKDEVIYMLDLPKPSKEASKVSGGRGQVRVPDRLPNRKGNKKADSIAAETESMKALNSFWAETPVAYKARRMLEEHEQDEEDGEFGEPFSPGAALGPFTCSKSNTCGNDDGDFDQSIVSYKSERHPATALPPKSRSKSSKGSRNSRNNRDAPDLKTAHEDIFKYHDLGQTLSDVMDAKQKLENAYGRHSGGASFDHTIDEQLVELLAHMAEMNHDDAVEIEAAIKKLKRHARKLGISEKDLLFSVKSAEESALSMTGEDEFTLQENLQMPHTFGDKMLDAFDGYFGRK